MLSDLNSFDMPLKGRFSFRLGTSSYIIPTDILSNLEYLKEKVDDVEILLFESDKISNIPTNDTVLAMKDIADQYNLTYTIHLPLDIQLGNGDETIRQNSIDKCLRIFDRMIPLLPFGWILHFHGDSDQSRDIPSVQMDRWRNQHKKSLERLVQHLDEPHRICVETLIYDFSYIEDIVKQSPVSICMDVGHLILKDRDPFAFWQKWQDQIRVFHLHGVTSEKTDHADLTHLPEMFLALFLDQISTNAVERVLTVEVFNESDFIASFLELKKWRENHG